MFSSLLDAMQDMMNALAQCFADIASEIVRIFKRLGDFRNYAQKACDSCNGSLITRRHGLICQDCGFSFKRAPRKT